MFGVVRNYLEELEVVLCCRNSLDSDGIGCSTTVFHATWVFDSQAREVRFDIHCIYSIVWYCRQSHIADSNDHKWRVSFTGVHLWRRTAGCHGSTAIDSSAHGEEKAQNHWTLTMAAEWRVFHAKEQNDNKLQRWRWIHLADEREKPKMFLNKESSVPNKSRKRKRSRSWDTGLVKRAPLFLRSGLRIYFAFSTRAATLSCGITWLELTFPWACGCLLMRFLKHYWKSINKLR